MSMCTKQMMINSFTVWKLSQKGRVSPRSASAVNVHIRELKVFSTLSLSANDQENPISVDLGVTGKFQQR
jgi:hypothetical protein